MLNALSAFLATSNATLFFGLALLHHLFKLLYGFARLTRLTNCVVKARNHLCRFPFSRERAFSRAIHLRTVSALYGSHRSASHALVRLFSAKHGQTFVAQLSLCFSFRLMPARLAHVRNQFVGSSTPGHFVAAWLASPWNSPPHANANYRQAINTRYLGRPAHYANPFSRCSARVLRPWHRLHSVCRFASSSVPPSSSGTM